MLDVRVPYDNRALSFLGFWGFGGLGGLGGLGFRGLGVERLNSCRPD